MQDNDMAITIKGNITKNTFESCNVSQSDIMKHDKVDKTEFEGILTFSNEKHYMINQ